MERLKSAGVTLLTTSNRFEVHSLDAKSATEDEDELLRLQFPKFQKPKAAIKEK